MIDALLPLVIAVLALAAVAAVIGLARDERAWEDDLDADLRAWVLDDQDEDLR